MAARNRTHPHRHDEAQPADQHNDNQPHRVAGVSDAGDEATEPGREPTESDTSGSHIPVEGGSGDANPGFETGESAAYKQNRASVTSPHEPDERGQWGGPR